MPPISWPFELHSDLVIQSWVDLELVLQDREWSGERAASPMPQAGALTKGYSEWTFCSRNPGCFVSFLLTGMCGMRVGKVGTFRVESGETCQVSIRCGSSVHCSLPGCGYLLLETLGCFLKGKLYSSSVRSGKRGSAGDSSQPVLGSWAVTLEDALWGKKVILVPMTNPGVS